MSLKYIQDPFLTQVCKVKVYECEALLLGQKRFMIWKNTNKLLALPEVIGLKTGITPSAGPCLSTYFIVNEKPYISIVINCRDSLARFSDT